MALEADQWAQIRRVWEYDPDQPSYVEAGRRAGEKFGFIPPSKQSIGKRALAEKWERMGAAAMSDVAAAAHRKADVLMAQTPPAGGSGDGAGDGKVDGGDAASTSAGDGGAPKKAADASAARSSVEDAEDLRAKVVARHRQEWEQVAGLRQEALIRRPKRDPVTGAFKAGSGSVAEAFEAAKLAKITAEMTSIQQAGERKAWGLDVVVDPDQLKTMSEADLIRLASGKPLKG